MGWDAPWESHSCGAIDGVCLQQRVIQLQKKKGNQTSKVGHRESQNLNREEEEKGNYEMIQKT